MELRNCDTTKNPERIPVALTVAGSDSGGGAGIQADLRTFSALGVFGTSAITAVTSQNPGAVSRVDALPPDAVAEQIRTVMDVIDVRAVKTGMLLSAEIIRTVANCLKQVQLPLVVDPVMISTSGTKLMQDDALESMMTDLLPLATWITPNIPEAELLCGKKLSTPSDLAGVALELHEKFKCNVILKSGHLTCVDRMADIVCCEGKLYSLSSPVAVIRGNASHGTGCTLSAAIAALLATGKSWQESLTEAKAFVYGSLLESRPLNGTLFQMYPPEKQYLEQINLEEL